jgi:MIP family channel proteins
MPADFVRRLLAEVIGTFGFFFAGFCGIAALRLQGPTSIGTIGIAAGFGFGLSLMIFAFGHVSGGHYNPAVSAGLAAARRFPPGEVLPYWGAQLVGGIIAAAGVRGIFNKAALHATLNMPAADVSNGKALLLEGIFTFLFVLVIATVAADARAPWNGVFAPFAIGLFIFTAATVCGPFTSGSFNPARSLAPAIVDGSFSKVWIFIVGPLAGGILGGVVNAVMREPDLPRLDRIPEQPPGRPEPGAAS